MMKIKILILLLFAAISVKAQTPFKTTQDSAIIGVKPTAGTRLSGKVYMPNLSNGLSTDSVLVLRFGKLFKVPRSQFALPGNYIVASPSTPQVANINLDGTVTVKSDIDRYTIVKNNGLDFGLIGGIEWNTSGIINYNASGYHTFTIDGTEYYKLRDFGIVRSSDDKLALFEGDVYSKSQVDSIAAGGGGGSYTSDNGITKTGNNFSLGGALNSGITDVGDILTDGVRLRIIKDPLATASGLEFGIDDQIGRGAFFSAGYPSTSNAVLKMSAYDFVNNSQEVRIFSLGSAIDQKSTFFDAYGKGAYLEGSYHKNWVLGDSLVLVNKIYVDQQIAASSGGSAPDTTVYRTVLNSFNKAQTNTQIANAISAYTPPSQVDNDLAGSTSRAPSKTAVVNGLALKANLSGTNNFTGGFQISDGVWQVTSVGNKEMSAISSIVNNGTTRLGSLKLNQTSLDGLTTLNTGILTISPFQTGNKSWLMPHENGQLALLSEVTTSSSLKADKTTNLIAGNGLAGGGDISANRTFTADTSILATKANSKTLAQLQTASNLKANLAGGNAFIGLQAITGQLSVSQLLTGTTSTDSVVVHDNTSDKFKIIDGSFNVSSDFTGTGTVGSPFSLNTVPVSKGGTGLTTLPNGILKSSSNVIAAAIAGTDFVPPTITIAGFALNANITLGALTALNTTLTFSGSYNGATARTIGLNLGNANTWTAQQSGTTPTAKDNTTKFATTAFTSKQFTATGSGTGAATTITVAHGITGVTSANSVIVFPNNAAAAGISYATMDATNVNIVYTVAPASGTNNLAYSISIK